MAARPIRAIVAAQSQRMGQSFIRKKVSLMLVLANACLSVFVLLWFRPVGLVKQSAPTVFRIPNWQASESFRRNPLRGALNETECFFQAQLISKRF
jgi:hypothetical protein